MHRGITFQVVFVGQRQPPNSGSRLDFETSKDAYPTSRHELPRGPVGEAFDDEGRRQGFHQGVELATRIGTQPIAMHRPWAFWSGKRPPMTILARTVTVHSMDGVDWKSCQQSMEG